MKFEFRVKFRILGLGPRGSGCLWLSKIPNGSGCLWLSKGPSLILMGEIWGVGCGNTV